jgi:heme-degrading monooxygenase HmoA
MYRAKQAGRDRWMWAREGDDEDEDPIASTRVASHLGTTFVAFSQLEVPEGGEEQVERAFRDRLRAVERWPGFQSLEVWADLSDPAGYVMVSWWATPEAFKAYMRSDDHRRSHDRIPGGELRPRPRQFRRYRIVSR